jgi:hypothetical protein
MSCLNLQPSATSIDKVSPFEQFSSTKLDAKRDLRVAFGDYVLATHANTDSSMLPRAEPCIALGGNFNLTGSVLMLSLRTNKIITRDKFVIQPMMDIGISKITELATRQGYSRGAYPTLEFPQALEEDMDNGTLRVFTLWRFCGEKGINVPMDFLVRVGVGLVMLLVRDAVWRRFVFL